MKHTGRGTIALTTRTARARPPRRWLTRAAALALGVGVTAACAAENQYPQIGGTWVRTGRGGSSAAWDPSKPPGLRQEAPLTPEYQALFQARVASRTAGGQEFNPAINCLPAGMPRVMVAYDPIEIIVTPQVTYVRTDHLPEVRRIFTDGRDWPAAITPTFHGYSIGKWVGDSGGSPYRTLEVETHGLRGPRVLDVDGMPLHDDNQTIVKERIYLDQSDHDILNDEITLIDHAYTRPWTTMRGYHRDRDPMWLENNCGSDNHYVVLGSEAYFISADGYLMPTKKGQQGPDLRNFGTTGK